MARLDRQTAAVTRAASAAIVQPESQLRTLLTRRELEIAQLMADGLTNPEIARRLVISEGTVKTHVSNLLRKLHASNRAQAASTFMRLALRDCRSPRRRGYRLAACSPPSQRSRSPFRRPPRAPADRVDADPVPGRGAARRWPPTPAGTTAWTATGSCARA